MILFVFEGKRREPNIFKTLEALYFASRDGWNIDSRVCVCYCSNLYALYGGMTRDGVDGDFVEDIIPVLKAQGCECLPAECSRDDFSEVYLFFDLECQHQNKDKTLTLAGKNEKVREMLEFFDNETEHGKLFVSYPMVEAFRYTKILPDPQFVHYKVKVSDCGAFKQTVQQFSAYPNLDFCIFKSLEKVDAELRAEVRQNWGHLVRQNVIKGCALCTGRAVYPFDIAEIQQVLVFDAERRLMEGNGDVSILSAFPFFLVEYFGLDQFAQ